MHDSQEIGESNPNPYSSPQSEVEEVAPEPIDLPPLNPYLLWGSLICSVVITAGYGYSIGFWQNATDILYYGVGPGILITLGVTGGLGFPILVRALRTGTFSRLMPGHWFLIGSCGFTVMFATEVCLKPFVDSAEMISVKVQGVVLSIFFLAVTAYSNESILWRVFLWFLNLFSVVSVFIVSFHVYMMATGKRPLTLDALLWGVIDFPAMFYVPWAFLACLAGIPSDWFHKTQRDWLHWVGILCGALLPFFFAVAMFLTQVT
ncbi:hypothetical protein GC197_05110 [bacterium]|nr:hypothetical protein [bacterium]